MAREKNKEDLFPLQSWNLWLDPAMCCFPSLVGAWWQQGAACLPAKTDSRWWTSGGLFYRAFSIRKKKAINKHSSQVFSNLPFNFTQMLIAYKSSMVLISFIVASYSSWILGVRAESCVWVLWRFAYLSLEQADRKRVMWCIKPTENLTSKLL